MPPRKPTKRAAEVPELVRRLYPDMEPINSWELTPVEAAMVSHDSVYSEMEGKWGVEVLQRIVNPDLAARFASAKLKLSQAIKDGDQDLVVKKAKVVVDGLKALDAAAEADGRSPLDPGVHMAGTGEDGSMWLICATVEGANSAARDPRWKGYQIWSFGEFIRLAQHHSLEAVLAAKRMYPGAVVERVKPEPDWTKGDEVGL